MAPSPLAYSVRWTSKLIRRDIRSLAIKCTSGVRSFFSAPTNVLTPQAHVEFEPYIYNEELHDDSIASSSNSLHSPADNNSDVTASTQITDGILEPSGTLYSLLTTRLKALYTSRDHDMPLEKRWEFRGAWLLLDMATQCCLSNPSFEILRGGNSVLNESALLLEVLRDISNPLDAPATKISQIPTRPYSRCHDDPSRRDSGLSYTSMHSHPSPALLWYIILAGATDMTKTICAAECLLGHVWPEQDAAAILEVVGNPAKRLPGEESTELRVKLGHLLYPEYDVLC
ncbi:hypothetical protein EJ07DRAFT_130412 [Lizonia empirigonia]|nr:hypothetical protein EJ07DRAFT_130412 [Lizonia empirigonia]